jgi:hypothetical protein
MEPNQEQINSAINPEILKAFDLMWDAFPSSVLLVRRNRTIAACNQAAIKKGLAAGMKCFQLSNDGVHDFCRANAPLDNGVAEQEVGYRPASKKVNNSYWLPIAGEKDLFVHVTIDISQYAKPELFQAIACSREPSRTSPEG